MTMKDDHLLELKDKVSTLEKQDASYVAGFSSVLNIVVQAYEIAGTPLQKSFLSYLTEDVNKTLITKTENGKFRHLVK